jgi:rhamnose transport system ATP-binding protein
MPEQQLVEIARALGANARILILDEPTASLTDREVDRLLQLLRDLRARGVGIIYISHRLEELFQMADRVTILRDGSSIATKPMAEIDRAEMIRLMVGRDVTSIFPKQTVPLGDTVIESVGVGCCASGIHDVSFAVRSGEIVGFSGLVGAGRTELARVLFGLTPADRGVIRWRGGAMRISSPAQAVDLGIAYVPEDRRRYGVILEMPVASNTTLAVLNRLSRFGFLNFRRERAVAAEYVRGLAIKTASLATPAGDLSGGNQQKVAISRWLATRPALLILDEPTQGIDVGAKAEIHRLMGELAAKGMAILMISSELPEILGMSDRIVVMHSGSVAGTLNRAEATPEKILSLALGHPAESAGAV